MPADGHEEPSPCGYNTGIGQHGEAEDYKVNISGSTGLAKTENDAELIVYPNPASDYLYFTSGLLDDLYCINIFNTSGKLVHSQFAENKLNETILKVCDLPAGIYVLKAENKEGVKLITTKFAKHY